MKTSSAFKLFLPLFIVVFAFTSCDMNENPVGTFEEAVERVPDVQLIEGADNATINVRYDRQHSYFTVNVSNIGNLESISDGVYYAWCLQMDRPISTNSDHSGTKLYSTSSDKIFNKLNYIINRQSFYVNDLHDLTWKDIQVAMWVILETPDLRIETIADQMPSSVDGYIPENVNAIISDVQNNGRNFKPQFGHKELIMANSSGENQDIGFVRTETAFGGDSEGDGSAWWYYFDRSGAETQNIWAGQTMNAGDVTITESNNVCSIEILLDSPWILQPGSETVKIQGYNENELPTSRPSAGQFETYKGTELSVDVSCYDYFVIHLDVGVPAD